MIEVLVPKYSSLKVFRITEKTTAKEVQDFFTSYKQFPKQIKKTESNKIVIRFNKSFRVTLKSGSILYFDGLRFNYVLAEDASTFDEFFFKASYIISNDVYVKEGDYYCCKNCGLSFKEAFNTCPNCGITPNELHDRIKHSIKLNKIKEVACTNFEQYKCPTCNFISLKPFKVCPQCQSTDTTSTVEFTDLTTKLKEDNMCKNNVEEVEEKEEATEVTAVYGDCVSVDNTEVQQGENQKASNI